jgi:hypothetical protein
MNEDRKKILVNQFQTRLFFRIVGYWLIYQIAVWNILFLWQMVNQEPGNVLEQYWTYFQGYAPTLLIFLVLVPVLAWDAVRFTHRLVGPIVRFRRAMQDITDGKPVRKIKLREGDFLVDMQQDFNQMLGSLESRGISVLHPGDTLPPQPSPSPVKQ